MVKEHRESRLVSILYLIKSLILCLRHLDFSLNLPHLSSHYVTISHEPRLWRAGTGLQLRSSKKSDDEKTKEAKKLKLKRGKRGSRFLILK